MSDGRKPTKIAFVSNTSWSVYNFRIEVIRSFITHGYKVFVLAPRDHFSAKLIAEGVVYIPVSVDNYGVNPFKDIVLFIQLALAYRKHHFEHIFHFTIKPNIYGSLAAFLNRIPSTAITTGLGRTFSFKNSIVSWVTKVLYVGAGRCAREMWFLNITDRDEFVSRGIIPVEKTFVLPSEGVNTAKYFPGSPNSKSVLTRFLYAGRILREKGIVEYVAAAKVLKTRHQNLRFEILGFIDEKNPNSISQELLYKWQSEGFIRYLGSTEDVRPYLSRADCLVFPSYYREGMSRILLEASSMRIPIITTNNVGCKEIVRHFVTGLLCEPRSKDSLVEAIEKFIGLSPAERSRLGANGRSRIKKHFDVEMIIALYHRKIADYCKAPELSAQLDALPGPATPSPSRTDLIL